MIALSLLTPHWWLLGLSILTLSSSSSNNGNNHDNIKTTASNNSGGSGSSNNLIDKYLKPFDLELFDFADTGRGVRTLVDRSPGDILLQIPVEDTITAADEIIISEPSHFSQEQQLATTLFEMNKRKSNHPYVSQILPKNHYAIWNLPDKIWDQLKLPRCYQESFLATRQMVQKFVQQSMNVKNDDNDDGDNENRDEKERSLQWAFSMVRSRSLAVPELQSTSSSSSTTTTNAEVETSSVPIALIPGLDLLNHRFGAGPVLQLNHKDDNDSQWTLTSSESYSKGDQIFLSYGDEKDNWKLLLTYGFAVRNNPQPLVFWTWQDLLQAAGQVRPSIFPDRVQQSLLRHPQLYDTYTVLSEQRATFSYHTGKKEPRESLTTGLQMVASLSMQLRGQSSQAQQDDDDAATLVSDLLQQLLKNRRTELKESIASVENLVQNGEHNDSDTTKTIEEEWRPFLLSLKLAMEEELESLLS